MYTRLNVPRQEDPSNESLNTPQIQKMEILNVKRLNLDTPGQELNK